MDIIKNIIFFSDRIVDWLQARLQLPWDDINGYITDLLPNRGMEFPYMAGRLAWWGFLAAILLHIGISLTRKKRSYPYARFFRGFTHSALLATPGVWVFYSTIRDTFFLGEASAIHTTWLTGMPQRFSDLIHGTDVLNSVLGILLGLAFIAVLVIILWLAALFPMVYLDELRPDYGRLSPLVVMMNTGLVSSALSLILIGLYYVIANGGAVFALKVWLALIIIALGGNFILLVLGVVFEMLVAAILSFGSVHSK